MRCLYCLPALQTSLSSSALADEEEEEEESMRIEDVLAKLSLTEYADTFAKEQVDVETLVSIRLQILSMISH